jgi:hypothetical protein
VLTALGGVLARVPSDTAVQRLSGALELAAGPERDSILDALGLAPSPSAVRTVTGMASSAEPTDRREVAALLAAHQGDPAVLAACRKLLSDGDADVRAQAAWTLGAVGDASDETALVALARSTDLDAATSAAAALARISGRLHAMDLATRVLCPLGAAGEGRSSVRANALAGLGLAGARCGDGSAERLALGEDLSEDVRAAAARALARAPGTDDARALDSCARNDPSGAVAARCRTRTGSTAATHALLVYFVPDGATGPHPGSHYALLLSDGLLHCGITDRRGAVFDPVAPEGVVTLRSAAALR